VLAGPFATMLLADLGADVIKVEPPAGDESRGWGPPFWGDPVDGLSAYFASVNRNKRSLVLDLSTDAGQAVLDRLADASDLLVHNARPASARRLGLNADRLASRHPQLVVAVVGGFGTDGPLADRPAYDLLAQAVSGLMAVTGDPGGEPMKVGVALLDLMAGLEAAVGALASLIGRDRPRRVEVPLVEVGVTSLINVLANLLASGDEPQRHGNAHPNIVPYQTFRAADGDLAIAVGNDAQFARLSRVLGITPGSEWATNAGRLADRSELIHRLSEAIAMRGRDELVQALDAADVPAGPVNCVGEALAMMERTHEGRWLQEVEGMSLAPNPLRVDGDRLPLRLAPPRAGEHSREILAEAGFGEAEIQDLVANGVVRVAEPRPEDHG
jgi:crotonobetainyl-CoA:carnitine CoA-transferase CaiB-like acyl-CoA transferase